MYPIYKKWLIYVVVILTIILLSACSPFKSTGQKDPQAVKGMLDLHNWDFAEKGIVSLKGEWSFYWEQLLTPHDFNLTESTVKPQLTGSIMLPGSWNNYQVNGEKLKGTGYATYRLFVETQGVQERLGLKIKPMSTAYKLWVNGELLSSNGIVNTSREKMSPQYSTSTVYFSPGKETIEIVLQSSNFMHHKGGLRESILLGTSQQISDKTMQSLAFEMFITGSLMIMGVYHIGLFALRRNHRSPLYFGMFCLFVGVRSLFVGEYYGYELFGHFSWTAGIKTEYLLTYLSVPIFVKYIQNLYPKQTSDIISKLCFLLSLIYSFIVIITPVSVFTATLFSYHMILLFVVAYVIYTLTLALLRKEKGAALISLGVIFYTLTIANDILHYNEVIETGDMSILGLFVFVFAQSFVLSMKFSKAYSDVELMSGQLQELNVSLEEKIANRTHALVEFNQYLTSANEELSRMEESRRHLLSNISHDLRTPMTSIQGYLEAILDRIVVNPDEQRKYLQLIHSKTLSLTHLINDLFQLSQLEARETSFNFQKIEIKQLIHDLNKKYETDVINAGLNYRSHSLISETSSSGFLSVDPVRIDQVFSNIIFNAIRHTPTGGTITISVGSKVTDKDKLGLLIKITDTGNGITEEKLPFIFDRFYKESDARNTSAGGSGLGLAISKEIILSHGGNIWAESTPGKGSAFCFILPLIKEA